MTWEFLALESQAYAIALALHRAPSPITLQIHPAEIIMRWLATLLRTRRQRVLVEQATSSVGTASASQPTTSLVTTTAITNDEQRPLSSSPPNQARTGFEALPFDLYISIIKLAISVESEFSPKYDIHALRIVNAVCRHWRRTALSAPSLWAYIPSYLPPHLFQVFLGRSADALLHIDLVYGNFFIDTPNPRAGEDDLLRLEDIFLAKLDFIIPHSHRIRFLSLSLSAMALISSGVKSRLAQYRAPVLEGLCFTNNSDPHWSPLKEKVIQGAELSIFTKLRSHVLRELHFIGVTIPPEFIPTSSVSSLSLTLANTIVDAEEYLRDVLSRGLRLVSLSLYLWSVGPVSGMEDAIVDRIFLPELHQLTLRGTCDVCAFVYRLLSAPSITEICLKTGHTSVESATRFIPRTPAGDRLCITVDESAIKLAFLESENLARNFSFTLFTDCTRGTVVTRNDLLLGLLRSRHFPQITSVEYSTSSRYDSIIMPQLLSHISALHELSLTFINDSSDMLSISPIEDAISLNLLRSPSSPLHSLRRLVYCNLAVVMPQASPFLIELSSIVRGRERSGQRPLVLEFKDCKGVTDDLLCACGLRLT